MRKPLNRLLFGALALNLLGFGGAFTAAAATSIVTIEQLARLPAVKDVQLSPDGKHIAAVTSPDGETSSVSIWDADNLGSKPVVIGVGEESKKAVKQSIWSLAFIKSDRILVNFRQLDNDNNGEPEFLFRNLITDISGSGNWMTVSGKQDQNARTNSILFNPLKQDPDHILVVYYNQGADIYKADIRTGSRESVVHSAEKFGGFYSDKHGNLIGREFSDFEGGKAYLATQLKNPDTGAWDTHFRWFAKDRDPVTVVAATPDPDVVLVGATQGGDKTKIVPYHIKSRTFDAPAFESPFFSVTGVVTSNAKADFGEVIGVTIGDGDYETVWTDPKLASIKAGLNKGFKIQTEPLTWTDAVTGKASVIPNPVGPTARIISMDDERTRFIVEYSGPAQPPVYYLLIPGQPLKLLARGEPALAPDALGDTKLVQYAARDGVPIPAYLTLPPKARFGDGPYPAVVLPHGGPWGRDERHWDITKWNTFFASRGMAVIQPQFRGSEGWGQKLWKLGDKEWGKSMQDDNDDAAKWMIAQKVADPNRIAIFGYSYGGYAAIAGAIRPNGLYRCAIPAAGVMEIATFRGETDEGGQFEREFQHETIDGLDPMQHVREVSIPVLLIHGDRDQTVNISESRAMYGALKGAGKDVKLVTLKDWGHQLNKWSTSENVKFFTEIETFLNGPCGLKLNAPGGSEKP